MPIPVLAGIPWLAGVVGYFFSKTFEFFLNHFTRRIALVVAGVAVLLTITATFFAAIQVLIAGLAVAMPPEVVLGAGMFIPGNADECMTAVITAHVIRYAYAWQYRIVQYKLL